MIRIENKEMCCGCTACKSACPKNAITMQPDEIEGFLYPVVDLKKCINCGICESICPVHSKKTHIEETKGYIVRYKEKEIVNESTSGGAFTAFASYMLGLGAVVYGAGYSSNMEVVCKKATRLEELKEMRGSKFVQSNLGNVFMEIKDQLKKNAKVVFTGTPCQVAGLISYLKEKPNNLICIDFVCRGVTSPKLWKNYIDMMEKKYGSKIINARFKNKTYGYHATTMKIEFKNGKTWFGSGRVDPMMKAFVNELASRPSCAACAFKGAERVSDITMFDCYQFSKVTGIGDDDKGYTSLLVHTDKGQELLDEINSTLKIYPADVEKLIQHNGIMVRGSAKANPKREKFYEIVADKPIDAAMNIVSPISRKDHRIEKMKGFLFRTGLIKIAKRIKKETINIS